MPIGDYGDVATLGFGALARLDWPVTPQLAVTGRAGVLLHLLDDEVMGDASLTFVPIYGGVRYAFADAQHGPYVAGDPFVCVVRVVKSKSANLTPINLMLPRVVPANLLNTNLVVFNV